MSFREDMYDLIIDYDEPDMFTESNQDRIISNAIRQSGFSLTYDTHTGNIEEEITSNQYDIISMFYNLYALEKIRNKYTKSAISVSDEEGSGDFKERAKLIKEKIDSIKNSQLYKRKTYKKIFAVLHND